MGIFITKKPILDKNKNITGYETLTYTPEEKELNTAELSELAGKYRKLIGNNKVFFNLRDDFFREETINLFPRKNVGIEINEEYQDSNNIKYICKQLKNRGFSILIADIMLKSKIDTLLDKNDILKVDFSQQIPVGKKVKLNKIKDKNIPLLATNVNNKRDYIKAKNEGYKYFQGDFYSNPQLNKDGNIPAFKLHYLNLLQEINKPEPNFPKIENIIKNDVSLSYNLFRLINSAYFGLRQEIKSIRQALVLLGIEDYKKWLSLKIMRGLAKNKPDILIMQSLMRANFAEKIAPLVNMEEKKLDFFMMGLFSKIDAFLDRSLSDIISELPLDDETKNAVVNQEGKMGTVFKLIISYEKGEWNNLVNYIDNLNLGDSKITKLYFRAGEKTNQALEALLYD